MPPDIRHFVKGKVSFKQEANASWKRPQCIECKIASKLIIGLSNADNKKW